MIYKLLTDTYIQSIIFLSIFYISMFDTKDYCRTNPDLKHFTAHLCMIGLKLLCGFKIIKRSKDNEKSPSNSFDCMLVECSSLRRPFC